MEVPSIRLSSRPIPNDISPSSPLRYGRYGDTVEYDLFPIQIAPYASVIVNGVYWGVNTPRLITIPDAKNLLTPRGNRVCLLLFFSIFFKRYRKIVKI